MIIKILENYIFGFALGAILEFVYRSVNARKFVMPDLVSIQIYAISTAFIYLLTLFNLNIAVLIFILAMLTSGLEFLIGYVYLKYKKVMLWDYSREVMNYKGLVCLKFSVLWVLLSLIYYYFIIPIF